MTIRRSELSDSEEILRLLIEAFTAGYAKKFPDIKIDENRLEGFRKAVAQIESAQWFVAEQAGKIIGGIRLIKPPLAETWLPDSVEMKGLILAAHLQGQGLGLGKQLMDALKAEAVQTGAKYICGRVRKEAMELRQYYETAGARYDPRGDQVHPNVNLVGYVYELRG